MSRENGLGRLAAPKDGRDFNYLMRAAMPQVRAVAPPKPRKRAYREGPQLNQGQRPWCVEFGGRGFINAAPTMKGVEALGAEGGLYRECQKNDEWPGENYDGTSVRALMKVLSARGFISSYVWGQSVDDIIAWTNGGYGTAIIGTEWFTLFDDIGQDGFMRQPSSIATPVGGHCYRLNWFDKVRGGFVVPNTWGFNWGIPRKGGTLAGYAFMSRDLADWLLKRDGEVAAPTQVKIAPAPL